MQCLYFEHCNPVAMILAKDWIPILFEFWKNWIWVIDIVCWFLCFMNKFNAIASNRKINFFNGLQQKLNFSNIVVNHKRWLLENAIKVSLCLKMFVVTHWSEKWSPNMKGNIQDLLKKFKCYLWTWPVLEPEFQMYHLSRSLNESNL